MTELLKNQKLMGQFRHVLTFLGGIAVGKGIIGEDALNAILGNFDSIIGGIGAVVAVFGSIMSWRSKNAEPVKHSNGTPIAPMAVLAGCLIVSGAAGCATKPRTQTSHVIRPAEGPDKFGRSFPQDVVTIVQPMPKRTK